MSGLNRSEMRILLSVRVFTGSTLYYRWSGGTWYHGGHEFHKTTKGCQRNRCDGSPVTNPLGKVE
jgi:hypothetical protein